MMAQMQQMEGHNNLAPEDMNPQQVIPGQEGEDDEDDEEVIDLEDLDDQQREMLLKYLQGEYEKDPSQFPFPPEELEQQLRRQRELQQEDSDGQVRGGEFVIAEGSEEQQQIPN